MYDRSFFDTIRAGIVESAEALVPALYEIVRPLSVIDVGCGEGWWADTFARMYGCSVIGVDGPDTSSILGDRFVPHDLTTPLPDFGRTFDLAVCLEVAEHLPPQRADSFVADLCQSAPIIAFSAAIPGQGGTGHLNEQWPGYWAERFRANGYDVTGALRLMIWNDDRIENWYRQNLLLAVAGSHETRPAISRLFNTWAAPPVPLVHPVLYDARRR